MSMASSNPKDYSKKKRGNRSAKLKQSKLDARRDQWLSQVKNKGGCKGEMSTGGTPGGSSMHWENERSRATEIKPRSKEEKYGDGSSMHHYSDLETWPSNSPTSHTSSVLCSNDSGVNFTGSGSCCSRSSSGSSNVSLSGSMSEEDEGDDDENDCLDDWETAADAYAAATDMQKELNHEQDSEKNANANVVQSDSQHELSIQSGSRIDIPKSKLESGEGVAHRTPINPKAWRPNDAFRPQSLPNLSKQYSFPLNSGRQFGRGGPDWGYKNVGPVPTSCPICYEDLDVTDTNFLPCPCEFRLCLFCHKRILEDDGRCPGCRKQYDHDTVEGKATSSLTIQLARSCSMITRS